MAPPLPPGFVIQGQPKSAAPPLPPGFVIQAQPQQQMQPARQTSPFADYTETMARGMVRGVPFVGPHLEQGIERLESVITDRPMGEVAQRGEQLREEHPAVDFASELAGTFLVPAGALGAGARLAGAGRTAQVPASFRLQEEAKRLYSAGGQKAAADKLWKTSMDVARIERAISRARGNPDRLRQNFEGLARDNKFMRRLTDEQRELVWQAARNRSNVAEAIRGVTSLKDALVAGFGLGLTTNPIAGIGMAAGQGLARLGARGIDKLSASRAAQRVMRSVEGGGR